jgi:hypothetical protein
MLDFPLEDLVFVVAALGGACLLAANLFADVTGRIGLTVGGAHALPLLAFVWLLGLGGLVASRILDVHGAQALLAATGAGVVGMGLAILLRGTARRAKD